MAPVSALLVCPACHGALAASGDALRCPACALEWRQSTPGVINLMPQGTAHASAGDWARRQETMLAWYEQVRREPGAAAFMFSNDYAEIAHVLRTYHGRVLDVGGGCGIAKAHLPDDAEYINLEPATEWFERDWSAAMTGPPSTPVAALAERMPFGDGAFDVVLMLWSLNHVLNPGEAVRECERVLRHGGRACLVLEDLVPIAGTDLSVAVADPQPDHLILSEDDLRRWTGSAFVTSRRLWAGRWLLIEFVKEPGRGSRLVDQAGAIDLGQLRAVAPVTRGFGYERGQPVDRYYIERFLASHAPDVLGDVLEVGDDTYARRYGHAGIRARVLRLHADSSAASIVGDLVDLPAVADAEFDCIICTQTLQLIYELRPAAATLHRLLKPGGVLLVTVPGISQIDDHHWQHQWCWSFTPRSARLLFEEFFGHDRVEVSSYGNVLASVAFLEGLAAEDLTLAELDATDSAYPLLIAVRAVKSPERH